MARQSSDSLSLRPAELWNFTTPELDALFMVALASTDTPTEGPLTEALSSADSDLLSFIWTLPAERRVEVST